MRVLHVSPFGPKQPCLRGLKILCYNCLVPGQPEPYKCPEGRDAEILTCLLARTTKGNRGSSASSQCSSCRAVGRRGPSEESTTNTSTWA